jgi:hypothetical protein
MPCFNKSIIFILCNFIFGVTPHFVTYFYLTFLRKDRTTLDYILSEDAIIIPTKGILRACAIYLPVS